MDHVLANAEESVRRLLGRLEHGEFAYEMDNGAWVRVRITIDKAARSARFDFTGTSDQLGDNFNAPYSIVRAASLYVVRTLIDDVIPMNDGCLRPIEIVVPAGSMLNPAFPAAVVAGNVETSQVVTDTLFAATGRLAPSQGTMNNFTFGNERYQYYETVCGGAGAGPDFDGASAVQTHMVEQLGSFASEVTRVAREVGTEGKLGGQANVKGVAGTWKDLTDNVNAMDYRFIKTFSKRTKLSKEAYENVVARWQELGLTGSPPVISVFEDEKFPTSIT